MNNTNKYINKSIDSLLDIIKQLDFDLKELSKGRLVNERSLAAFNYLCSLNVETTNELLEIKNNTITKDELLKSFNKMKSYTCVYLRRLFEILNNDKLLLELLEYDLSYINSIGYCKEFDNVLKKLEEEVF